MSIKDVILGPLIRMKPSCNAGFIETSVGGIELAEHRCVLDKGHPGMHRAANGAMWKEMNAAQRFVEDRGTGL